jgi:deoxyribodipyrimidine photolyase-related protein
LYWDFIARNEERFAKNTRMSLPLRNWQRRDEATKSTIRAHAADLQKRLADGERL